MAAAAAATAAIPTTLVAAKPHLLISKLLVTKPSRLPVVPEFAAGDQLVLRRPRAPVFKLLAPAVQVTTVMSPQPAANMVSSRRRQP